MLELLLQTGVNALYAASFMALIAVGLVLIFGVMGIINFALLIAAVLFLP